MDEKSKAEVTSMSQFDNSLMIEGRKQEIGGGGVDGSMIGNMTDISKAGQSSFLGSEKPKDMDFEVSKFNNTNNQTLP